MPRPSLRLIPVSLTLAIFLVCQFVRAQGQEPDGVSIPQSGVVTFAEHIAPIIYNNCTSCHRPDEAAPFVLTSYRDVAKRGRMIAEVVGSGYMPPWHPASETGPYMDDRSLSESEIDLITQWVDQDMPEGDPARTPSLPEFPEGWQLGEPDLVVSMAEAFEVNADGPDVFRNLVVPINLPADKWVTALELRPSAPEVVHHVLYFLGESESVRALDGQDGSPGFDGMRFRFTGSLGGWAVGATPRKLPYDLAVKLPAGSDLVLQCHFHPTGKIEREQTTIGLYFADSPPEQRLGGFMVPSAFGAFARIDIPPGDNDYTIRESITVPHDIDLIGVGGHAHYICTQLEALATLPDGERRELFRIDDWDFNWQGRYYYQEPIRIPAGTVIDATITYDNSEANPRNPNVPPVRVTFGEQSNDEMGTVLFQYVNVNESESDATRDDFRQQTARVARQAFQRRRARRQGEVFVPGRAGRQVVRDDARAILKRALMRADSNDDGILQADELPARLRRELSRFDLDGSKTLDADEIRAAVTSMTRPSASTNPDTDGQN